MTISKQTFDDVAHLIRGVIMSDADAYYACDAMAQTAACNAMLRAVKAGGTMEQAHADAFVSTSDAIRANYDDAMHAAIDRWNGSDVVANLLRELATGWGSNVWDIVARDFSDEAWAIVCDRYPEWVAELSADRVTA